MKVASKKKEVQQFEPIEVTIVIENKEELSNLLARLSIDDDYINESGHVKKYIANGSDFKLYYELIKRWNEL